MQIVRYIPEYKKEWDAFIDASKNGTFLLKRDYMDYHSDRFTDCSHLFYDKNKLVAVLPANIREEEHALYSHQGLTYGGLIMSKDITAVQVLEIFDQYLAYIKQRYGIEKLVYKAIPYIYSNYPAEEDLYALFRNKARLKERRISSAVQMEGILPFTSKREGKVRKAERAGVYVKEAEDYSPFWHLLTEHLQEKFGVNPVHTLDEIVSLANCFPNNIKLFEVRDKADEGLLAGGVVYICHHVAHLQYSSANMQGMKCEALSLLFDYLIHERFRELKYMDFGVSDEQGGQYLNEGLIYMKESCAGRAVLYDTYELLAE